MAIRELKTALIGSKSIEDEGDESIQRRVVNETDSLRILLITDTLPYPPVSGNRLRVYHLCQQLAVKHEVWMIAPERPSEPSADAITHLEQFCERVITTPYKKQSKLRHLPGILRYALTGKPPELKFEHSSELLAPLRHLVNTISFDIVHMEPSYIALYREALPPTLKARCVITYQNIDFDLHRRIAQVHANRIWKARAILHSLFMQRWEPRYAGKFTRCITCSERDQRLLLQRNPGASVEVVPNGVDTLAYTPLEPNEGPPAIMFIGSMSYRACADGAVFFHDEALPIVRDYVPDVETWLVGRDPTPDVLALAGARVHVTGWVEDVLPYYMRASLMIVPLRAGGGTRLKILEAMALGRTVVSTSIGCEGLDVVDGEHIMIADDPREFAEKTIALLTDNALCMRLTQNARDLVCKQYDWRLIAEKQIRIYREIVQNGSISVPPPAALSIQLGELSAT
jgi:glycosyltransferase involved in cell wall biosynthesis